MRRRPEPQLFGLGLPLWRRFMLVAGLLVLAVAPWTMEGFSVFQLTQAAIYAIAILGLNLLTGFNGQFSLGHSAFYAIGAYTAAILMDQLAVPYFWTLPAAALISFAVGFAFGFPALRLEGLYLALATFVLAVAIPQLLKFSLIEDVTGGVQGIVLRRPKAPEWSGLSNDQWLYYFTIVVMLLLFWLAWNLVRGRSGRAIVAIRDNPIAASAMGINTPLYKTLTFGVSAAYTGVAGAISAIVIGYVAPDSFTFFLSVALLVGVVVGGLSSISGAIFGGLFVLYVPNFAEDFADVLSKGLSWAAYGIILILIIYLMPSGVTGLIKLFVARLVRAVDSGGGQRDGPTRTKEK